MNMSDLTITILVVAGILTAINVVIFVANVIRDRRRSRQQKEVMDWILSKELKKSK